MDALSFSAFITFLVDICFPPSVFIPWVIGGEASSRKQCSLCWSCPTLGFPSSSISSLVEGPHGLRTSFPICGSSECGMSTEEISFLFFSLSEARASTLSSSGLVKRIHLGSLLVHLVLLLSFISFLWGVSFFLMRLLVLLRPPFGP